jgi:hypothetical protein
VNLARQRARRGGEPRALRVVDAGDGASSMIF